MRARWMAALVLLWPVMASAASCEDAKDTAEINECLHNEVEKAEVEMAKYLKASRERLAEHPDSIVTMELAQSAWVRYRDSHCLAVYDLWAQGNARGAMLGSCLLEQTERRTHDIWKVYLTYVDSDDSILPEPPVRD